MKRMSLLAALLLVPVFGLHAGVLNGKANLALGQRDFDHSSADFPDGAGMTQPQAVIVDTTTHRLFVADASRAVFWDDYTTLTDGQSAAGLLGQPDLFSIVGLGPGAGALNFPGQGLIDAAGALWIVDGNYNRVLRFSPPFATGMLPDLVLGQGSLGAWTSGTTAATMNQPKGIARDSAGRLWISDSANHRVLRFSPPFSSGMSADLVLGQADLNSGLENRGAAAAANSLKFPGPLAFDPAGNLWVCDSFNHRLLRFDAPIAGDASASRVLGQGSFVNDSANRGFGPTASSLFTPLGLAVDGAGAVWVGDSANNRVVRYSAPISNGMAAGLVLGQADLTSGQQNRGGAVAADTLNTPAGVALDDAGGLWVTDGGNLRVLRYLPAFSSGMAASRQLGQIDFTHATQNLVDAKGLHNPTFFVIDAAHDRAFASDAVNNRVLWWNHAADLATGKPADGALGQPDLFSNLPMPLAAGSLNFPLGLAVDAGGAVWVADDVDNRVLRFSPPFATGMNADLVLGQPNFVSGGWLVPPANPPTAATFNVPYGVAIDSAGAVWVADDQNGRLLRFRAPFSNGMNADLVLGQADFVSVQTQPGASVLVNPTGLAFDASGAAWAADGGAGRVLRFSPPLSNGKAADLVLGQPDFTSDASGFTPDARSLAYPVGVVVDAGGGFWAADQMNNRVMGFVPPFSNGMAASRVLGQTAFAANDFNGGDAGLANPSGLFVDGTNALWVADEANGRVLKFIGETSNNPVGTSSSQTLTLDGASGAISLDVPAGTFAQNVNMTISIPPSLPPAQSGVKTCGVGIEITNSMGLQPLKPMTLKVGYRDADVAGLDPKKLSIAYFNPASGQWVAVASSVDPANHTVTGFLPHLSLFAIVQLTASSDLNAVHVFPNPYKPGSGTIYDDSALGSGIVFSGLTASARIRVLTMAGELVADVTTSDGLGRYLWNARNDRGELVAAGLYYYVVTNPYDRGQSRSGRFAIVR